MSALVDDLPVAVPNRCFAHHGGLLEPLPICVRDKLLVHCNQGGSRALSLALLFLAKCRAALSNDSYLEARSEYEKLYPGYKPGPGIQAYLRSKWHKLGAALRQGGGLEPVRR